MTEEAGANYFISQFSFGNLTQQEVLHSAGIFAGAIRRQPICFSIDENLSTPPRWGSAAGRDPHVGVSGCHGDRLELGVGCGDHLLGGHRAQ